MTTSPFGTWISPIDAETVAAGETRVEWAACVGDEVWWTELRPQESGRSALVRRTPEGVVSDVLTRRWNVRTRVIEYGGRPWLPLGGPDDGFVFTNWDDQRVHLASREHSPRPISPEPGMPAGARYSDFARVGDEVWCLREATAGHSADVHRDLIALPLDGGAADEPGRVRVLAATHHFMTGPKISPDGRHVCWLGWDHPAMPWDGTEVLRASVAEDGSFGPSQVIAGGPGEAVTQIEWDPERPDTLYLLSDLDGGWWNLHEVATDGTRRNLCARAEEFGEPLWRIGARFFLPLDGGRLAVAHGTAGRRLAVLGADGALRDIGGDERYTEWAVLAANGRCIVATAAGPRAPRALLLLDPQHDTAVPEVLRPAGMAHAEYLSPGRHEVFYNDAGEAVHAYVHPPHNPRFTAPGGELPPYVVHVHGGPTTRTQCVADLTFAYFTSRGIGVVDVQYGGSTGFGRAYRERLRGQWGVADVQDCAAVARGLAASGTADPERLGIRGGSAGGWTAVASLASEPELYRAAGIYFPLLDPEAWSERGTHDFESRYLESLIGPWPAAKDRYAEVSPLRRANRVKAPFVLLQGLEDEICPPAQAEGFLRRLGDGGPPRAYLAFEGEQHGFRRAGTLVACLHAELSVYAQCFGFAAPGVPRTELTAVRA
jgi:dipeptidyl aminopeptidase/acylaminoacyl peptidase